MNTITTPNFKGITLKELTGMMNRIEKRIAWYNKASNFGKLPMSAKDTNDYNRDLAIWDRCKEVRDELKAATIAQA